MGLSDRITFSCKEEVGHVSDLTTVRPEPKCLIDCTNREKFDNTSLPDLYPRHMNKAGANSTE